MGLDDGDDDDDDEEEEEDGSEGEQEEEVEEEAAKPARQGKQGGAKRRRLGEDFGRKPLPQQHLSGFRARAAAAREREASRSKVRHARPQKAIRKGGVVRQVKKKNRGGRH